MIITNENIDAFKKAYNKAVEDKLEIFIFESVEVLTQYAKYVIEYVNSQTEPNFKIHES
jgi:hypothetical protein